jgi:hypothetical protein
LDGLGKFFIVTDEALIEICRHFRTLPDFEFDVVLERHLVPRTIQTFQRATVTHSSPTLTTHLHVQSTSYARVTSSVKFNVAVNVRRNGEPHERFGQVEYFLKLTVKGKICYLERQVDIW